MIILDVVQGSEEWLSSRRGIPTASEFSRIITTKGVPSKSAGDYIDELVSEWITGESEYYENAWMKRGKELEPEARENYEFMTSSNTRQVGLVYRDEAKMVACSPDGLMDAKGLEIKCLSPKKHYEVLKAGKLPTEHYCQVHGSMWVTGIKEWDFFCYHPKMKNFLVTVGLDEKFSEKLTELMNEFIYKLLQARKEYDLI